MHGVTQQQRGSYFDPAIGMEKTLRCRYGKKRSFVRRERGVRGKGQTRTGPN